MELMCDVTRGGGGLESWVPTALADALCAFSSRANPHARRALLAWLSVVRTTTEDYDPVPAPVRVASNPDEDRRLPSSREDPLDDILGDLGREIFKLEEYQRRLGSPGGSSELNGSIIELFDICIDEMTRSECSADRAGSSSASFETAAGSPTEDVNDGVSVISDDTPKACDERELIYSVPIGRCEAPATAPRMRPRRFASSEYLYANMDRPSNKPRPLSNVESLKSHLDSDSDASSTHWRYRAGSTDEESEAELYAPVWGCSSGFHNSDGILLEVIKQNHAEVSSIKFDTVSELAPDEYDLYTLPHEEEGCEADASLREAAVRQSPVYGAVCDARDDARYASVMLQDENIYEEIDVAFDKQTCDSVEILSCGDSVSSEDRCASPEYVNLTDCGAYAITADVIYWKNLLLLPDYNEDEEDEWITPEESMGYGAERRPPFIIPRITSYRYPPHRLARLADYSHDLLPGSPPKFALREATRQNSGPAPPDWSPVSDRGQLAIGDVSKLLGSSENLSGLRRPSQQSATDACEVRDALHSRRRKARSMLSGTRLGRSPVPAPRNLPPDTTHHTNVIFEGKVKRTKVSENGKKLRKNWTENHLVLTRAQLLFYKDEKCYQAAMKTKSPPSPPGGARGVELCLPLHGATVAMCTIQHTSRFAKALAVTLGSDQILIQDDSAAGAKYWFEAISKAIANAPPEDNPMSDLGGTPISSRKNNNRKDEPVFGRSLEEVCGARAPRVPEFVERVVREIESSEENLRTDGLYRASGNLSQVQRIRLQIDQNNLSVVEQNADVHVLAGSLKLFFRELKEPLVPCRLFNRTLAATGLKSREARVAEFREIARALPACNYDTLKFLLQHLLRVTEYSSQNRMHVSNLAIVFGPTLLWAPPELQHNIATDCIQQNHAIEILLTDFHQIFQS